MKILTTITLLLFAIIHLNAATTEQRSEHFNVKKGVAIQGYDPVSYFSGQVSKGNAKHAYTQKGVTYYFASSNNLNTFKKNPTKYEPQYGGWCAYALAENKGKVKINPKSYKIVNGKLYLFFNSAPWGNTLKAWNKKADGPQIKAAHAAWAKFVK